MENYQMQATNRFKVLNHKVFTQFENYIDVLKTFNLGVRYSGFFEIYNLNDTSKQALVAFTKMDEIDPFIAALELKRDGFL
jgi:hypothetical protein